MDSHYISHEASNLIILFLVLYLLILIRFVVRYNLDLIDFFLLATVALIPSAFVFLPSLVTSVCHLLKIELPMALLFGILMVFIFAFFIRLARRCFKLESKLREVSQELALRTSRP